MRAERETSGVRPAVTLEVEGTSLPEGQQVSRPFFGYQVDSDYFSTMGHRVVDGRTFTELEIQDEAAVMVLGESTADAIFQGGDPVGQRMRIGGGDWWTVVGVVEDVSMTAMDTETSSQRQIYLPISHDTQFLLARTSSDVSAIIPGIRASLRAVAPETPVEMTDAVTLLGQSVSSQRLTMRLLVALAGLAVGLAALGLYGVVAQTVSRRRREIGIRMSLGARRGEILWMVLRGGGVAVGLGMILGVALAVVGGQVVESLLVVVEPVDLPSYLGAAAVLVLVSGVAILLPARRATRVDPVLAMSAD